MTVPTDEVKRVMDVLQDAVAEGRHGIITHVDLSTGMDEAWLIYITETPSGRRYGALTRDSAAAFLESVGVRLIEGEPQEFSLEWEVRVEWSASTTVRVRAGSEQEARDIACETADPMDATWEAEAWRAVQVLPEKAGAA